jgi:uncharacterized protein YodC (DUF2158 family)
LVEADRGTLAVDSLEEFDRGNAMSEPVQRQEGNPGSGLTIESLVTLADGTAVSLGHLLVVAMSESGIRGEVERLSAPRLSRGCIVSLRSGGPPMTVVRLSRKGRLAKCQWFDLDGKLRHRVFPSIALWKLDPETGEPERIEETNGAAAASRRRPPQDPPEVSEEEIPF